MNEVMKNFAKENFLVFNTDVKLLTIGGPELFYEHMENNQNTTWFTIVWCTSEWPIMPNISIPCKF